MTPVRPAFRLCLAFSLLLCLLVGVTTPAQAAHGDLFSWGRNDDGQLGDGSTENRDVPGSVTPDFEDEVIAVAAGFHHSLALLANGTVWAWGRDYEGQLGNGDDAGDSLIPTQVPGLPVITAIAAGNYHTLALAENGTVYAWGMNDYGQLGIAGDVDTAQSPTQVTTISNVVDIAAGFYHTLALTEDGTVYAWGMNDHGQLGIGSDVDQSEPTIVATLNNAQIVDVAAGSGSFISLAIAADGTLYEWGFDQLGENEHRYTPVVVEGISDVIDAAPSYHHIQALTAGGTVYSWGYGGYNGTGNPENSDTPKWVMDNVVAVAAGAYHGLAIDATGALWSWGANDDGQLGTGGSDQAHTPALVDTSLTFSAVAAGLYHTLAIEADIAPPITTATVNGEVPGVDWYPSATVALMTDEPATTTYEVNGGPTQAYTSPFTLPDGVHTVTYRSTDAAGNVEGDQTLTVQVRGSSTMFADLSGLIADLPLTGSTGQTLQTQVAIAEAMADAGQTGMACMQLANIDLQVKAQESKRRISRQEAAAIYAQTQELRNVLGCGGASG